MSTGSEGDRFELLAAAGEVADGTLLVENTVAQLLELVVPAFADIATLDSISPDGELRRLGSRVDAPRREELEATCFAAARCPRVAGGRHRGDRRRTVTRSGVRRRWPRS